MKFFEPASHFEYFKSKLLPRLAQSPSANIWSSACANGAEAYSLSLLVKDYPHIHVWGSDSSQQALESSIKGHYVYDEIASVPEDMLQQAFRKGVGAASGQYRVHDVLRQSVQFYSHNLRSPFIVPLKFDVIFCQNVLSLCSQKEQEIIERNLVQVLATGGFLFIGLGEKIFHARAKEIAPSVYQH